VADRCLFFRRKRRCLCGVMSDKDLLFSDDSLNASCTNTVVCVSFSFA